MRKASVLILSLVALLGASVAWAEGSQEECVPEAPRGFSEELITLTGPVDVQEDGHPNITSGGKTYRLMIPRFMWDATDLDVDQGEKITVEGFAMAQPFWSEWDDESSVPFRVTKAVIDGKEYIESVGARVFERILAVARGDRSLA